MRLVLDASALVVVAASSPGLVTLDGHTLTGPAPMRTEAISAIHESLRRAQLSSQAATTARDRILDLAVDLVDDRAIYIAAWDTAERFGLAKTYDAMYVALAKSLNIPLLTEDGRLRRTVGDYIRTLGLDDLTP